VLDGYGDDDVAKGVHYDKELERWTSYVRTEGYVRRLALRLTQADAEQDHKNAGALLNALPPPKLALSREEDEARKVALNNLDTVCTSFDLFSSSCSRTLSAFFHVRA
jgi:hypothetical protein